jgi:hypothetical protein
MKNFILVLSIFFSFVSFSQSESEALQFLNTYSNNWGCEKFADGTLNIRLTFKVENGNLIIKEYFTTLIDVEYAIYTIELKKIEMIQYERGNGCMPVIIKYDPNSFRISIKLRNQNDITEYGAFESWEISERVGFKFDSIRLKEDPDQDNRADRIVKALEYLANKYYAKLKKSSF